MLIRRELPADEEAVRKVQAEAFRRPDDPSEPPEVALLDRLRRVDAVVPGLSLVAVVDGEVVGHVVCSRGHLEPEHHPAVGLGPIGVRTAYQQQGVGSALMHAIVAAADTLDEPFVALLGEPAYYCRFGFQSSTQLGIKPPQEDWGDYFQVRPLTSFRRDRQGTFAYAEPFNDL